MTFFFSRNCDSFAISELMPFLLFFSLQDNFSGYDFENRLSFRVHAALARIEERKAGGTIQRPVKAK